MTSKVTIGDLFERAVDKTLSNPEFMKFASQRSSQHISFGRGVNSCGSQSWKGSSFSQPQTNFSFKSHSHPYNTQSSGFGMNNYDKKIMDFDLSMFDK